MSITARLRRRGDSVSVPRCKLELAPCDQHEAATASSRANNADGENKQHAFGGGRGADGDGDR